MRSQIKSVSKIEILLLYIFQFWGIVFFVYLFVVCFEYSFVVKNHHLSITDFKPLANKCRGFSEKSLKLMKTVEGLPEEKFVEGKQGTLGKVRNKR